MPSNHPNLVYVFADQMRYQSVGYTGDKRAKTPNIDKLARSSMNLPQCVSGSPMCAPYRASLFTGKYSSSTGMVINELRMNPNHRCFGHVLHDNDYDTYYIGKWHLWANELGNHHDPKNSYTPPGEHRLGFDGYWASYGFHHTYWDQYYHEDSPEKIVIEGYEPDGQTDLTIEKLKLATETDKPFALFLSLGTPHDPWNLENVPDEYLEMFADVEFELPLNYKPNNDPHADQWARLNDDQRAELTEWMRVYYAMTTNLDWNIGRLVASINDLGLFEDTIFVFTSDHGEMFGAQGRRAKNIFYDEAVRVPFLIRWDGHIQAGSECDIPINTPDIMPTLLSVMGLDVPDEVEGYDFSPTLLGQDDANTPEYAFMQGMGATAIFEDGHEWRALRNKHYTYAVYLDDDSEYLFDNIADPHQMTNLADAEAHAVTLATLRRELQRCMDDLNDTFEACTWYQQHWIENRIIKQTATLTLS